MFGRSVSLRLILLAIVWIVSALAIGGVTLSNHFSNHVTASLDKVLNGHIEELLSYSDTTSGTVQLTDTPSDPDYLRPLSGWYWEIRVDGKTVQRSRSLWDQVLDVTATPPKGRQETLFIVGPRGRDLRVVAETFSLPGHDKFITIYVTGPAEVIMQAMEELKETLTIAMIFLGFGLFLAVLLQVFWGLRPLNQLRRKLVDIHAGREARLSGRFPTEVEALVEDMNRLLDHNDQVIERARTHAGNLAHALKTPLAVLQNETTNMDAKTAGLVREQTKVMTDLVTRHLSRARAAGSMGVPGVKADLGDVLGGLKRTLTRIYASRGVNISLVNTRGVFVVAERQDLEEALGNLMDNACKWTEGRVRVSAEEQGRYIRILVEDNGPGVPDDKLEEILGRGKRLDEATPGSGLGLNIVTDLIELYHGKIELGRSELGGLKVILSLPKAS